jgi:hypothetical protein
LKIDYRQQVHFTRRGWDGVLYDDRRGFLESMHTFKPDWGFWTSTRLPKGVSHWRLQSKDRHRSDVAYHFEVVGEPKILELETHSQAEDLLRSHGIEPFTMGQMLDATISKEMEMDQAMERHFNMMKGVVVVWRALSEQYDAVHAPFHFQRHGFLDMWDVESTVWFKPATYLRARPTKQK